MNIYARFFDQDTLVHSLEELFEFLHSIPEINVDAEMMDDIRTYVEGNVSFPKRYRVRPRVYFILIKTSAASLEEFKANGKAHETEMIPLSSFGTPSAKDVRIALLSEQREGWYRGQITFKRVLLIPGTSKFQYQDTDFEAYVRTTSGMDCYNCIVAYLKSRPDVDIRSQFPSARGMSFVFEYVGETLPQEVEEILSTAE